MLQPNPLTPRLRQETEAPKLLRQRRPIPILSGTTSLQELVTSRFDADFLIEVLFVSNVTASAHTFTAHLIPVGGTASALNAIALSAPIDAHGSGRLDAISGMLLGPNQQLVVSSDAASSVNFYGWGYDIQGDYSL